MAKVKEIGLTSEQYATVSRLSGLGLPQKYIAAALDVSKATFERWRNKDPKLNEALLKGEAAAHGKVLQVAFEMATSGEHPALTIFYLKCRLQWSPEASLPSEKIDLDSDSD
jgi:hypothetical protein